MEILTVNCELMIIGAENRPVLFQTSSYIEPNPEKERALSRHSA
jgi:hypothetical protein